MRNDPLFDLAVSLGFHGMSPEVIPNYDVMVPDVATVRHDMNVIGELSSFAEVNAADDPGFAQVLVTHSGQFGKDFIRMPGVLHAHQYIDDGFGRHARYGRASEMFDRSRIRTDLPDQEPMFVVKPIRPLLVIGLQVDGFVNGHEGTSFEWVRTCW